MIEVSSMERPDLVSADDSAGARTEPPDSSGPPSRSPVRREGRSPRKARKISVGSVLGLAMVTMLVALVLFIGFCAIPGLKSNTEDEDRTPGAGVLSRPQSN
jgi:hypothetical protein